MFFLQPVPGQKETSGLTTIQTKTQMRPTILDEGTQRIRLLVLRITNGQSPVRLEDVRRDLKEWCIGRGIRRSVVPLNEEVSVVLSFCRSDRSTPESSVLIVG